jgi:hypothetical protein
MDHFNATVLDGNMVSTRRGFQVTKHKHNGIAFVNSSVRDGKPKISRSKQNYSIPVAGEITFVTSGDDGRKQAQPIRRARITKDMDKPKGPKSIRTSILAKEEERRLSWSTASSSSASTPPSTYGSAAEELNYRDGQRWENCVSSKSLPAWASYKIPGSPSDSSKRLLFMTLAFVPDKSCPFDEDGLGK